MCLGPGTEIQGTGSLFCQKISPPICSPICWDFFADLGGGGLGQSAADEALKAWAAVCFGVYGTLH